MKIPRKHHSCVSISTKKGERLLAVGGILFKIFEISCMIHNFLNLFLGIDQNDETITTVELFNPITKTWELDTKRSLPVGIIK